MTKSSPTLVNAYFMNVNETCQFTVYPEDSVNIFKINTYLMFSVIKLDFSSWIHPSKCTHDHGTFMENCNFESLKVNTTLMLWPIFNVTEVARCVNRGFFQTLKLQNYAMIRCFQGEKRCSCHEHETWMRKWKQINIGNK